jgi:hypothetical protein
VDYLAARYLLIPILDFHQEDTKVIIEPQNVAQFLIYGIIEIRDQFNVKDKLMNWKTDTEPLVLRAPGLKEILSAVQTVRSTLENNNFKVK